MCCTSRRLLGGREPDDPLREVVACTLETSGPDRAVTVWHASPSRQLASLNQNVPIVSVRRLVPDKPKSAK